MDLVDDQLRLRWMIYLVVLAELQTCLGALDLITISEAFGGAPFEVCMKGNVGRIFTGQEIWRGSLMDWVEQENDDKVGVSKGKSQSGAALEGRSAFWKEWVS
ncbi:hypothetical protein Tco_0726191 [Tanacetum coccineum]|uniref:Uncharacterized protein n=1 Tax=Tanacetum coccineum TaxID=301880 RepID=A0ABQ4YFS2_9ASTR